jgi:hypothetical protein
VQFFLYKTSEILKNPIANLVYKAYYRLVSGEKWILVVPKCGFVGATK